MVLLNAMLIVALGAGITDPIADFIAHTPKFDGFEHDLTDVEVIRADIDGDGYHEVFVRSKGGFKDRQGVAWVVYTPSSEGYVRLEGFAHFHPSMMYVGNLNDVETDSGFRSAQGRGIITFRTAGSGKGTLVGIQISDKKIKSTRLREISAKVRDKGLFDELFAGNPVVPEEVNVENYQASAVAGNVSVNSEDSTASSKETTLVENAPSIRVTSIQEADEPRGPAETANPQLPENSGWSAGVLLVSIGAAAFLLAFAGYRVFSKKGRTES